jgi:hypothetical protein
MKSIKIPKTVAGVKVPSALRGRGPVAKFLSSSAGKMLIAEAVVVGLAALAMRKTKSGERTGTVVARRAAELGKDLGKRAGAAASRVRASALTH